MRKEAELRTKDEEDRNGVKAVDSNVIVVPEGKDQQSKANFDESISERVELKKFIKWEKEGQYSIEKISQRDPDIRTQEEKIYFMMFLKFRVPFFKSFQREVLNMLTERF